MGGPVALCAVVVWRGDRAAIGFSAGAPARSRPAPHRSRRHRCERRVPRRCDRPSHLVVLHGGPRPDEIGDRTISSDGAARPGRHADTSTRLRTSRSPATWTRHFVVPPKRAAIHDVLELLLVPRSSSADTVGPATRRAVATRPRRASRQCRPRRSQPRKRKRLADQGSWESAPPTGLAACVGRPSDASRRQALDRRGQPWGAADREGAAPANRQLRPLGAKVPTVGGS